MRENVCKKTQHWLHDARGWDQFSQNLNDDCRKSEGRNSLPKAQSKCNLLL